MKKLIIKSSFIFSLLCVLAGCLKDKKFDNGTIQAIHSHGTDQNIVEIKLTAGDASNVLITSFDAVNKDTIIDFVPVNLASPGAASEDINVTLVQDDAIVNDYNAQNGTNFVVPGPSQFTVVNSALVVTIPKGSHTGYLQVKLNPSAFVGSDWALAYSISAIDKPAYHISANMSKGMVGFGIKNKYDGHYSVTGTMVDVANNTLTGRYPMDVYLVTQGANSVAMVDNAIGTFAHSISSGGGLSYYGSFAPVFTFDPASDFITGVTNYFGQPAGNGRSGQLDVTGENRYNSDKSIDVKYFMLQPSVAVPYRTSFDEHFTYLGPR
jgi:hypothetical protein